MDKIYMLNHRLDNKNSEGSILGLKGDELFYITIDKEIINNQYHQYLKKSFKYCSIKSGDSPLKALLKYGEIYGKSGYKINEFRLSELINKPGAYYPRIFRPFIKGRESINFGDSRELEIIKNEVFQYPEYFPRDEKILLSGLNQLSILKEMLLSILINIYPSSKNLKTYGHSIKNLLVLSCIEVETQLKGIYKANEISSKTQYTTKDYFKLKILMQLDKYEVKLPFYPELKSFIPFKNWDGSNPTKSLDWYNNYNAIKHNSELDFNKATLSSAVSAICAVAILIKAQYGSNIPFWKEEIGSFFTITDNTKWNINQKILPPLIRNVWLENKIGLS